jgi:phosphate transport system permease protein
MQSMNSFLFRRRVKDILASKTMLVFTVLTAAIILLMIAGLYFKSRPILASQPLGQLLFSSRWHPFRGEFGFLAFIMGTLWVTGVAVLIAVPIRMSGNGSNR